MNPQNSSRKVYRILFWLWCIVGVALLAGAFSPQLRRLERNRQAAHALESARDALSQVRAATATPGGDRDSQMRLLERAAKQAEKCADLLGKEHAEAAVAAEVERALVDLESGHAFDALKVLTNLEKKDRPNPRSPRDPPWTRNTPMIVNAIAETRYKIALMCREEGDGYENWSNDAEQAAHYYQELADHPTTTADDRERHLKNLATCTRLIHGADDSSHSLGFPACKTIDCVRIARTWERPPPSGGGGSGGEGGGGGGNNGGGGGAPDGKPWKEPPEPDENTKGK